MSKNMKKIIFFKLEHQVHRPEVTDGRVSTFCGVAVNSACYLPSIRTVLLGG